MCEGFFRFLNRIKRILGLGKGAKTDANEKPEKKADKPNK